MNRVRISEQSDGTYKDLDFDVIWTKTDYTEQPVEQHDCGHLDDWCKCPIADICLVCDEKILTGPFFVCLDDSDCCHIACATVYTDKSRENQPNQEAMAEMTPKERKEYLKHFNV